MNKRLKISLWVCCLSLNLAAAQNEKLYALYTEKTGIENSVLFNGREYIDTERSINGKNKFLFPSEGFKPGNISYEGQYFPDVLLRFNLVDDRLLIKLPLSGSLISFELIPEKISGFSISDHQFEKIEDSTGNMEFNGFYEKLFDNRSIKLYKKHQRRGDKKFDEELVYYEFKDIKPDYYLKKGDSYFKLDSKRDWIEIFPEMKEAVRNTYRTQKKLRKQHPDDFMVLLLDTMLNNGKNLDQ